MSSLAGRKLLVADDSVTVQKVVALTFTDEGCEVTAVGGGRQALEEIERETPDVVLADATMTEPNGYQVCAYIKGDERLRHVPVVLLVGAFELFNEAEARKSGADDVLTKPFQSIREMVSKVGSLLGGKRETDDEKPPAAEPNTIFSLKDARSQTPADAAESAPARVSTDATDLPSRTGEGAAGAQTLGAVGTESKVVTSPLGVTDDGSSLFAYAAESPSPQTETTAADLYSFDDDDKNIEVTPLDEQRRRSGERSASGETTDKDFVEVSNDLMTGSDVSEPTFMDKPDDATMSMNAETMTSKDPVRNMPDGAPESSTAADEALLDLDGFAAPSPLPPSGSVDFSTDDGLLDLDSPSHGSMAVEPPDSFDDSFTSAPDATGTRGQASVAMPVRNASPFDEASSARDETMPLGAARRDERQITLDQIAPEVIEAIARRVVEQLSEREVREVAWEVVPALAERMIKQRLETDEQGL